MSGLTAQDTRPEITMLILNITVLPASTIASGYLYIPVAATSSSQAGAACVALVGRLRCPMYVTMLHTTQMLHMSERPPELKHRPSRQLKGTVYLRHLHVALTIRWVPLACLVAAQRQPPPPPACILYLRMSTVANYQTNPTQSNL